MSDIRVICVSNNKELEISQKIREVVFCEEQKVSKNIEFDGLDSECDHFLILKNDKPVGTARLREKEPGVYKIERVAVLRDYRFLGLGAFLMKEVIKNSLNKKSLEKILLHSQTQVKHFYKKLGFEPEGSEFFEDDIPHIKMIYNFKTL
tara:strand:- start:218 stop:664 length:447 start_codon:yes stop_codon:yes gene_type:complete